MIGTIVEYTGEAPSAIDAPDVAKVIELFKQQNEILKAALTSVVCVPAGTRLRTVHTKAEEP